MPETAHAGGTSFIERMQRIDSRLIYLAMALVVLIPLIRPFPAPVQVEDSAQRLFDFIDALKAGDAVLLSFEYTGSSEYEIHPIAISIVSHLADKQGVRLIGVAFSPEGPMWADRAFKYLEGSGKTYGKDYINLGYRAGGETAIAAMANDILSVFPADAKGNPTQSHPVMDGITSAANLKLILQFNNGNYIQEFIRQVSDPYKVPIAFGMSLGIIPANMPFLESGQAMAMLGGVKGASEYELLTQKPGVGSVSMSAQVLGHILVIVLLCLGNAGYFLGKRRGDAK